MIGYTGVDAFLLGLVIGIVGSVACWIVTDHEKKKEHDEWALQMRNALIGSDFCEVGCGYYEQCFNRNKDKEIAMDELYHNYCYTCPIKMAIELLEKEEN